MSGIVDQWGRPISTRSLQQDLQTERTGLQFLRTTFEGHPSRGLTPAKVARILQDAEQGTLTEQAELMEDMEEKDGHIFAEMGKRRRVLISVPWSIEPPDGADQRQKEIAERVNELVQEIPTSMDDIILGMADGVGHAFANLELEWDLIGGYQIPAVHHRPANWFMTPQDRRNEIRLRNESGMGEPLEPFRWIRHVHKSRPGYIGRAGLVRVLAWPFLFKNYSLRDLAEFLEIYGIPLRLGKYPSGAGEAEKWALMQAVVGIGHNAAGIIPEGMEIDFKEAATGHADPFQTMIAFCERTESKAILGQTLTAQADSGSNTNALGKVHDEVRQDIRDSDLRQIASTLTRDLLYPLAALNIPGIQSMADCPRFVFDASEPEDASKYAYPLAALVRVGMQIPMSYVHERLGIPQAADGEAVLRLVDPNAGASGAPPDGAALVAALRTTPGPNGKRGQAAVDAALSAITPDMQQDQIEKLLVPLIRRINGGESFEVLLDELSDQYPQLAIDDIEDLLTRVHFVAEVWGRLNA